MANSETDFCKEIREAIEEQLAPAHCLKHSDAFIVGIADLQIQTRLFGHWLVEAKFHRRKTMTGKVKLELTEKQRKFLKKEQAAGGNAGWCLCVRFSDRRSHLYVGTNPDTLEVDLSSLHIVRGHGETWNAETFFMLLISSRGQTA